MENISYRKFNEEFLGACDNPIDEKIGTEEHQQVYHRQKFLSESYAVLDGNNNNIYITFDYNGGFDSIQCEVVNQDDKTVLYSWHVLNEDKSKRVAINIEKRNVPQEYDMVITLNVINGTDFSVDAAKILIYNKIDAISKHYVSNEICNVFDDFKPIDLKLKQLFVEVTSRCNLRCKSCSKFYGKDLPYRDMDMDVFMHTADMFLPHTQYLSLTGIGEPLYHRNARGLFDIIEKYPHLELDFVTNGELWDDYWLDRIGKIKSTVSLSMDGVSETTHKYNRGEKSKFEHLIWLLQEAKDRRNNNSNFKLRFGISMVIMRNNIHEVCDMIRLAKKYDLSHVSFVFMGYWQQDEVWYESQSPYKMSVEYSSIYNSAIKLAEELGVIVYLPQDNAGVNNSDVKNSVVKYGRYMTYQACGLPFHSLYIHWDGKVSPCCAMRPYMVGNVKDWTKNDVLNLWNSLKMRILRSQMMNKTYANLCLHGCDLNYGINYGRPIKPNDYISVG